MLFKVHGYYGKFASRKSQSKIEALVYAANSDLAEKLVKKMFDGYPAVFDNFSVTGGIEVDRKQMYDERPELIDKDPNIGFIYSEMYHRNTIQRYFK